jgi:hypothetical protein
MNPATLEKSYMQSLSDEPREEFGGPRVRYNNKFPIEIPCAHNKKRASHSPPFFTFPQ